MNRTFAFLIVGIAIATASAVDLASNFPELEIPDSEAAAPPHPPSIVKRLMSAGSQLPAPPQEDPVLYSTGDPSDEEQMFLEFINRARMFPVEEGLMFKVTTDPIVLSAYSQFNVDLPLMESQFTALPPTMPLSMNAKLVMAARGHSGDMFTNAFQRHESSTDGGTIVDRANAQEYLWAKLGENIFSYSRTVFHGHAAFNVDWGAGAATVGGMQNPPGHRLNIHNTAFREVGIGVVLGTNQVGSSSAVGPIVVTQDFGTPSVATPFILGVVYFDLNTNGFYDIGDIREGISGVTVTVDGSSYYAVTGTSGGYSVPVPGDGEYKVTFKSPGLPDAIRTITVTNNSNFKLDYVPAYNAPTLTGPDRPSIDEDNLYSFNVVAGASGYQWNRSEVKQFTESYTAEDGLVGTKIETLGGYSILESNVVAVGKVSYKLVHMGGAPRTVPFSESMLLDRILRPSASSKLEFKAKVRWSTTNQIAKVQISADYGASWQNLWTKRGNRNAGDLSYLDQSISLGAYAGMEVLIRFAFEATGEFFGYDPNPEFGGMGFYFDAVRVSNAQVRFNEVIADTPDPSFNFVPTANGTYFLAARPKLGARYLSWGPILSVDATQGPVRVRFAKPKKVNQGLELEFSVSNMRSNTTFQVYSADSVTGWIADTNATLETVAPGRTYKFRTPHGDSGNKFFKIGAQ